MKLCGTCMIYKRDIGHSIQLFDSDREIDYTDNEFCLAGHIIVILESDMCTSRGLLHVIWGDMCSIVGEDQETVLTNKKACK